jgi:methyl-accepting chemotaxis protein PixJ
LHDAPLGAAAVPIRIRDQVVGVIDARKHQGAGTWSAEEIGLLELLIDRLGQALDSAQIHQDSQQRAVSQQISAEITNRMRQSLDVETVLKTAADEMYQALNLDEIVIRLATPDIGTTPDAGDIREEQ